jgi:P-type E1-E2 ATPase
VDGVVIEGHGVMDESFLTGEPFKITKTSGSTVISGAINGEAALTIRTTKRAADSRYAKIMEVMRESEAKRLRLRRLGDQLGAIYTPVAVALAIVAWVISDEAVRFLAVMVIATPCPLLIAIPVAIVGSISLSARRGIIRRLRSTNCAWRDTRFGRRMSPNFLRLSTTTSTCWAGIPSRCRKR